MATLRTDTNSKVMYTYSFFYIRMILIQKDKTDINSIVILPFMSWRSSLNQSCLHTVFILSSQSYKKTSIFRVIFGFWRLWSISSTVVFKTLDRHSIDNRCNATITLSVRLTPCATLVELPKLLQTYLFEHEYCPSD